MDVYWLEQSEEDMPLENDWLSAQELVYLSCLHFPKRRADWRLGRWAAKCALADYLKVPAVPKVLASIELHPSQSGAPEVFFENKLSAVPVSLSHRAGIAVCAVASSGAALGCDLERIEPRSDAFVADYFTSEEQALVAQACVADRFRLVALLWSAKESALKALRTGLRLDTRSLNVTPVDVLRVHEENNDACGRDSPLAGGSSTDSSCWFPLQALYTEGQAFRGWWQQTGNLVRTIVAAPPPGPPIVRAQRYCFV